MNWMKQGRSKRCRWPRLAAVLCTLIAPRSFGGILVLAPHPDDDVITSAGVIRRAVGVEPVTVVYMTNGDINGTVEGLLRQGEAVNAQTGYLGTREDDLIFLGYPDAHLELLLDAYWDPSSQYFTPQGQGVTYGNRGLGRVDYHRLRFGTAAAYNRPNVVIDLAAILSTYRPDHIYSSAEFDAHPDHRATYRFLRLALTQVKATDPSYAPVVHKTLVWSSQWELWPRPVDPTSLHSEIPGLDATSLNWNERESLNVPLQMQDLNLLLNLKYRAIQAHASQAGPQSFIGRFAHKDEVFWSENPFGPNQPPVAEAGADLFAAPDQSVSLNASASRDPEGAPLSYTWVQRSGSPVSLSGANTPSPRFTVPAQASANDAWVFQLEVADGEFHSAPDLVTVYGGTPATNIAPLAVATASSENIATGQTANKAIDRLIDGFPTDYSLEWATQAQTAGAWIRLTWAQPVSIQGVRLHDRPNLNDWVTGGTLTFSDGNTLEVPSLNNDGQSGTTVSFAPRWTTSLTFTVTQVSASTSSVGLAEFLVLTGSTPDTSAPSIPMGLSVVGATSTRISLAWVASTDTGGSGVAGYRIYRNGSTTPLAQVSSVNYIDSGLTPQTSYTYRVSAYDGAGNESETAGPVTGVTQPTDISQNIAGWAAVSASSQNASTSQLALKAIDGIAQGYPSDYTREWATLGETTGAWIRLAWTQAYLVDRVVLHDRPNSNDWVTAGVLRFSDGSTVAVGPLHNEGTGLEIQFAPRAVNEVMFTVTGAGAASANIGLSEILVFAAETTATVPLSPSGLSAATSSSSRIDLAWSDNATNEAGYRLERSLDGVTFIEIATLSSNATSFVDSLLTANTRYYYQVRAYNDAGNSAYSNIAQATTPPAETFTNIAGLATVTASSENASTGQLAIKAIDGVAAGWPGDFTREWATNRQRTGAWIRLAWTRGYEVQRVVLHDRPNSNDWIRGGTLTFSDGSSIATGPLNNDGSGVEITFSPRTVTSVTFTVATVSQSTTNVGLAEVLVWGR